MTDHTAAALSCDWCGNQGHTADAHPLPAGHPHFDPELDDNPLLDMALADFLDWQSPSGPEPEPAPLSPLGRVLGGAGRAPSCNGVVHWWPSVEVRPGELCLCGQRAAGPGASEGDEEGDDAGLPGVVARGVIRFPDR